MACPSLGPSLDAGPATHERPERVRRVVAAVHDPQVDHEIAGCQPLHEERALLGPGRERQGEARRRAGRLPRRLHAGVPSPLRQAILAAAATSDEVEARGDNGYGDVYVLRFSLQTAKGSGVILTAWIIRHGEDVPRLTTCSIV
jgi:Domain of unknown function (DUF6883)